MFLKNVDEMELYELYAVIKYFNSKDFKYENNIAMSVLYEILLSSIVDDVYLRICELYFEETGMILDSVNKNDRNTLYNWAENKCRYELLNSLMDTMFKQLIGIEHTIPFVPEDKFLVNNLDELINIVEDDILIRLSILERKDEKKISKMSKDEVIMHVKNILKELDPSLEWLSLYNKLLSEGKVVYINELTEEEIKKIIKEYELENTAFGNSYVRTPKGRLILLNYEGTSLDLLATVHEFIHYINDKNFGKKQYCPTLEETFAVFYQLYTIEYLNKLGYDKNEIISLKLDSFNNVTIDEYVYVIFEIIKYYFSQYYNNGRILEESEISDDDSYELGYEYNLSRKESCDMANNILLLEQNNIILTYAYIIGGYLARNLIISLRSGNDILPKMKKLSENKNNVDPYDLFEMTNLNIQLERAYDYDDLNQYKKRIRKK